jgi:hypothetical protein
MVHQEFSEEGRNARFEQWEKYGVERLKADLETDADSDRRRPPFPT